jgi:hypothetical protein
MPMTLGLQLKNIFQKQEQARRAARPAPADSLRADSARLDSARADAAPPRAADRSRASADTTALPDRDVIIILPAPLPPGRYRITISAVRNVNGLVGGGSAEFEVKPAPVRTPPRTGGGGTREPQRQHSPR